MFEQYTYFLDFGRLTSYDQLANRTFAQVEECREEMNLEECAR